jgi:hypothetical protein
MRWTSRLPGAAACAGVVLSAAFPALARDIHVATTGSDAAAGSKARPYRTVSKAAAAAQPGDTVTVHAGTYREWVKPARGGESDTKRIVYRAAPGEEVVIKGSERVTSWVREDGGVWRAEIPNETFGAYNPFALNISGEWLEYGGWHHRGNVYLDGEALAEQETPDAVRGKPMTWFAKVEGKTTVWANVGDADPNEKLAEINVRESVFMPDVTGLSYITVDGFHFAHSAENWQPPGLQTQMGLIGPRGGKRWIIENCSVTHARCVGVVLGHAEGVNYGDIDAFGDHVVRRNVIRRCGQAGIAGQKGATRSLIEGNFIEDTNDRREFGGWETAAIKFHESVDTVIRGNLIRGVRRQKCGAYGIWMDWANQGTRISGNVIYDIEESTLYIEMNHGPILIDNNVLIGASVRNFGSEGNIYAHNLFVDSAFFSVPEPSRSSQHYQPHTRRHTGGRPGIVQDERWFNNLFIRGGLDKLAKAPGYEADGNVYLEGAAKSAFGDEHSTVDPFVTEFRREDAPRGVAVTFTVNDAPRRVKATRVDAARVGVLPTAGQTLEDRHGAKIGVDTDLFGAKRKTIVPGPLADLPPGPVTIAWPPENRSDQPNAPQRR